MRRCAVLVTLLVPVLLCSPVSAQTVAPVRDLACTARVTELGVIELSCVLGADYDVVQVLHFGELLSERGDDLLEGETFSFTTEALAAPQVARLEVVGIVDDVRSPAVHCDVALIPAPFVTAEVSPEAEFDIDGYVSALQVPEAIIGDMIIDVDIAPLLAGEALVGLNVVIESPSGTTVSLFGSSGDAGHLVARFWDLGPLTGEPRLADETLMYSRGRDTLSEFVGESTDDSDDPAAGWTLTVKVADGVRGIIHSWGISVFEKSPAYPLRELSCGDGREPGRVSAVAVAAAPYTAVRWFVNDLPVAVQQFAEPLSPGDSIKYTTPPQPFGEPVVVRVQGVIRDRRARLPSPLRQCESTPTLPAPVRPHCGPSLDHDRKFVVSWTLPDDLPDGYDHYRVFVDGVLDEVIDDGQATSYQTVIFPLDSEHRVEIQGVSEEPPGESARVGCGWRVLPAPELEVCQTPEVIDDNEFVLEVDIERSVVALAVLIQGADPFNDRRIEIESPDGTRIGLHEQTDSNFDSDFCFVFDDEGEWISSYGNHGPCPLLVPQGIGRLVDFVGCPTAGEWTLSVDAEDGPDFELWNWCLRFETCETLAPTGLTCTLDDESVDLTWKNASDYDEVRVYMDATLVETLDGDSESHRVEDVIASRAHFVVEGYSDKTECAFTTDPCWVTTVLSLCQQNIQVERRVTLELDVADAIVVGDVEVLFDASSTFPRGFAVRLTSPSGTRVSLDWWRVIGSSRTRVIWSSLKGALPRGQLPLDCGFCRVEASGPGFWFPGEESSSAELHDLAGEVSDGIWVIDAYPYNPGRIHEVCLDIHEGCSLPPPSDVLCTQVDDDVEISWLSYANFDSITITRNDSRVIADLPGDAESFTDIRPLSGRYRYRVTGHGIGDDGEPCDSARECEIGKGIQTFCEFETNGRVGRRSSFLLDIDGDVSVDEMRVVLAFDDDYVGHYDIEITNPDGETAVLIAEADIEWIYPGSLDVVFTDRGSPPDLVGYAFGKELLPVESLEPLTVGSTDGEWELAMIRTWFHYEGELDAFCVEFFEGCDFARPVIESCGPAADDGMPPVEVTWTDVADEAVEILVLRDDVVIATLDPDEMSFLDEHPLPGRRVYRVLAAAEDCSRPSLPCESGPVGVFTVCSTPDVEVTAETPASESLIFDYADDTYPAGSFDPAIDVVEVTVALETETPVNLTIVVVAPDGTQVTLLNHHRGTADGIDVIFRDDAPESWSGLFLTCECPRPPRGPGALADLAGQDPTGTWIIDVDTRGAPGTLVSWCVGVQPARLPTDGPRFLRGDVDNDGRVTPIVDALSILEWGFGDGERPPCMAAADVDNDGSVQSVADGVRLLTAFFSDGTPIPYPGTEECGVDPEDSDTGGVPEGCDPDGDGENDDGAGCD